jgi:uncharacterized membrane protein
MSSTGGYVRDEFGVLVEYQDIARDDIGVKFTIHYDAFEYSEGDKLLVSLSKPTTIFYSGFRSIDVEISIEMLDELRKRTGDTPVDNLMEQVKIYFTEIWESGSFRYEAKYDA